MKTSLPRRTLVGTLALGVSALLALGTPPYARAQTTYNTTASDAVGPIIGQNYPVTDPIKYNAVNLDTAGNDTLKVDQNVDFKGSAASAIFTSTTFTSVGGRVAASMLGVDWDYTTPVDGRTFIVQNFALDNVDFTTSNGTTGGVGLKIQGPGGLNTSLTLANSTLSCAITPHLYAPSAFTFSVSGTSQIDGWIGRLSSSTALTVASGGSLRIKNCGDLSSGATLNSKLYFDQYTNSATLNGSSLLIDNSAVVFGANPYGNPGNESTMTFSNNATLQLTSVGTPGASLETDNIVLQGSTLNMAAHTRLTLRNTLELDSTAGAQLGTGAQAQANTIVVKGSTTASLAYTATLSTGTLDIRSGATLNLVGNYDVSETTVNTHVLFPASGNGTLTLNSLSVLNLASAATMDLTSHAVLTNGGSINLQEGHVTVRQGAAFTNNIELVVQDPSSLRIDGNATIGGGSSSSIQMKGTLSFTSAASTPAANTLTVTNIDLLSPTSLTSNSTLQMALNPTGLTADRLVVSHQLTLESRVVLSLGTVNDTALALGTKFVLIDYPSWQAFFPSTHFNGLPDGAAFTLGLNIYQINYNDPDVQPGETHFITVTTVPEPGTLALLGLGALALAGRVLRRR